MKITLVLFSIMLLISCTPKESFIEKALKKWDTSDTLDLKRHQALVRKLKKSKDKFEEQEYKELESKLHKVFQSKMNSILGTLDLDTDSLFCVEYKGNDQVYAAYYDSIQNQLDLVNLYHKKINPDDSKENCQKKFKQLIDLRGKTRKVHAEKINKLASSYLDLVHDIDIYNELDRQLKKKSSLNYRSMYINDALSAMYTDLYKNKVKELKK